MWAVVPVRGLDDPKRRLAGVLDAAARAELTLAMLDDVLAALAAVEALDGILLVSADERVLEAGARHDARPLREPLPGGYNAAVQRAATQLCLDGVEGMLHLPGDVPLVQPADIEAVLAAHVATSKAGPAATLVADHEGRGTNCLTLSPPDLIDPAFGPDSFDRHCDAAAAAGAALRTLALPRLALDIDLPEDLRILLREPGDTESQRCLRRIGATALLEHPSGE